MNNDGNFVDFEDIGENRCIHTSLFFVQILSLGEQIAFNRNCEAAIRERNLPKFLQELEKKLKSYTTVHIPVEELGETGEKTYCKVHTRIN